MKSSEIFDILKSNTDFLKFIQEYPVYDIVMKTISVENIEEIKKDYYGMNLFLKSVDEVMGVTFVSREIQQNGYPKIKAYIDIQKKEILHFFKSF